MANLQRAGSQGVEEMRSSLLCVGTIVSGNFIDCHPHGDGWMEDDGDDV